MKKYPWFVRRDLDGFFGLFVDNLVQIMVIGELGVAVAGLSREFIYSRILPGLALSVVFGNLFYAWQARRLARRENRDDVTALPFGVNTPSVFAYLLFIMGPIYAGHRSELGQDAAARLAWQAGLLACFGSGLIELAGASVAGWIRRITPRAALLGALAGIAISFISMDFTLQVFEHPLLALLPAAIILIQYFSGVRLPLGMPAGLLALLIGTAIGWGLKAFALTPVFAALSPSLRNEIGLELAALPAVADVQAAFHFQWHWPVFSWGDVFASLTRQELFSAVGVIIPMGLFNVIGSLQNIESAEAAGDRFATAPALTANGLGTILAAFFGSCFPTTIYIGHPGWKRLGARAGYSILNGGVITVLCLSGFIGAFNAIVPIHSVIGILIWIAVIIGAQAFQAVPRRHAPAVILALFPALAAWGLLTFQRGLDSAGRRLVDVGLAGSNPVAHLGGMISLDRGFILTSMGWAALGVHLIDRRFRHAAAWALAMSLLSWIGIIHGWDPSDLGKSFSIGLGSGWRYAVPYLMMAVILWLIAPRVQSAEAVAENEFGHE